MPYAAAMGRNVRELGPIFLPSDSWQIVALPAACVVHFRPLAPEIRYSYVRHVGASRSVQATLPRGFWTRIEW